ncbi:beta-galactosidase [Oricola cellulosilytica]|uniref:Beta-galactosidase n=1 Tax=Oricola cellulosilytica TaxID=1429082 RepID=A0A4R0PH14_9HYPH|nr:beta-galactosidase [Oricola cellulosilytica]TCD16328.1 beta-galactosidase [Oricola cellulosilytica]
MKTTRKQTLGVCYYPEHWPQERWTDDARMMAEAGITHVRIGEFAWSRLEPDPGRTDFEWLDRAFETLHANGLNVVLGTPTATPPKWLVDSMPDMLAVGRDGKTRGFGSRRHYCFSHQGYRRECARIVTLLAKRYGRHPALAAWQTDNEYGCHDTVESYSAAALSGFRDWLGQKYQSPDALNRAWGNVFWSMEYRSFEEVELPNLAVTEVNPAHAMDFQRYSSDQVIAFNRIQTEIIREHSPEIPIAHNFMGRFVAFDHYDVSADLDIASWDAYPIGFLDRDTKDEDNKQRYLGVGDPDNQALHHDLYRACGQVRNGEADGRWWVMEQQPGPVNWAPWNPAPSPGAVRLWAWEAFAAGAEVVSYFRWRQPSFAQEQMHEALLLPDGEPNEAYSVCKQVAGELDAIGAVADPARSDVALVFDYESAWAWAIQPQGRDFDYFDLVLRFYRALRQHGVSVDVVPPSGEAVTGRKLVIVPGLFSAPGEVLEALADSDAAILLGPRTGSKNDDFRIAEGLPPGPFRKLIDMKIRRVESLPPFVDVPLAEGGRFNGWREFVMPGEGVKAVRMSKDGYAAHLTNGRIHYLAGRPDEETAKAVVGELLRQAGVEALDLHRDIRVRDNGGVRYVFNYGPDSVDVSGIAGEGEILFGETVLAPRAVLAFRRR